MCQTPTNKTGNQWGLKGFFFFWDWVFLLASADLNLPAMSSGWPQTSKYRIAVLSVFECFCLLAVHSSGIFDVFLRVHAVFCLYVSPFIVSVLHPPPPAPLPTWPPFCVHVVCVCDPVNFISLQEYGYISTYFLQHNLFFSVFFFSPNQGCILKWSLSILFRKKSWGRPF